MKQQFEFGNAFKEGADYRGWFVGSFIKDQRSIRKSDDIEVRMSRFVSGSERPDWVTSRKTHTICILISGSFQIIFEKEVCTLKTPGDFVIWGPNFPHKWRALTKAEVVSVRWPSDPDDSVTI